MSLTRFRNKQTLGNIPMECIEKPVKSIHEQLSDAKRTTWVIISVTGEYVDNKRLQFRLFFSRFTKLVKEKRKCQGSIQKYSDF